MIVFCLVISQKGLRNMASIQKCYEELFGKSQGRKLKTLRNREKTKNKFEFSVKSTV
jgi:hypothetical protein